MTHQQAKVLAFIRDYQAAHFGATPSYTEMQAFTGIRSRASIHRAVDSLRRDGLIMHSKGAKRSIIVCAGPPAPMATTTIAEVRKRDLVVPDHVADTQHWAWSLGYELVLRARP